MQKPRLFFFRGSLIWFCLLYLQFVQKAVEERASRAILTKTTICDAVIVSVKGDVPEVDPATVSPAETSFPRVTARITAVQPPLR